MKSTTMGIFDSTKHSQYSIAYHRWKYSKVGGPISLERGLTRGRLSFQFHGLGFCPVHERGHRRDLSKAGSMSMCPKSWACKGWNFSMCGSHRGHLQGLCCGV